MKVKICGINSPDIAAAACSAGADFIGMVFYDGSPRCVSYGCGAEIAALARSRNVCSVALTVDADTETLAKIVADVSPDYVQFHGNEGARYVADMRSVLADVGVIKVVKIGNRSDIAEIEAARGYADLVLADARPGADDLLPGGNARSFDWSYLSGVNLEGCLLAGGLTVANVGEAIASCHPWGVDVSSGVESSRGIKSATMVRDFIGAVRSAEPV